MAHGRHARGHAADRRRQPPPTRLAADRRRPCGVTRRVRHVRGRSLWTTDGTEAGTTKLRANGTTGNWLSPWGLFSDGATAYFTGQDDWLYRTDGTADGTRPIRGGIDQSSFSGLGRLGSAFLFGGNGELWRTDGSGAGTRSLQAPGAWFAAANDRTMLLTRLYGSARTDGETVTDEAGPRDAVAVPDGFLSARFDGLYTLDADGGNPRLATAIQYQQGLLRVGNRVIFIAGVPWRWHSADLSGRDVTELNLVGDTVQWATTVGEHAYVVTAKDYDVYLYRTDGTHAGTVLLHRFDDVDSDRTPTDFAAFDGAVYFSASDFEHGYELWRTDGTPRAPGSPPTSCPARARRSRSTSSAPRTSCSSAPTASSTARRRGASVAPSRRCPRTRSRRRSRSPRCWSPSEPWRRRRAATR